MTRILFIRSRFSSRYHLIEVEGEIDMAPLYRGNPLCGTHILGLLSKLENTKSSLFCPACRDLQ